MKRNTNTLSKYGLQEALKGPRGERSELAGFAGSDDDMAGCLPKTAWARNGREQQSTCPGSCRNALYLVMGFFGDSHDEGVHYDYHYNHDLSY